MNQRRHPGGSSASFYVRGHLLNHNLGGPGNRWENLTPITRDANSAHLHQFEAQVKKFVLEQPKNNPKPVHFVVLAKYGRTPPAGGPELEEPLKRGKDAGARQKVAEAVRKAEQYVPTALDCKATQEDGTEVGRAVISNDIRQDAKYNVLPKPIGVTEPDVDT